MKKLMTTMLAVAAGVSLHAVGMADTGTSFEGLTGSSEGVTYDITENGATGEGQLGGGELSPMVDPGDTYWVTNGTETLKIVAITSDAVNRPTPYEDAPQNNYLSIKTTLGNPVTRNAKLDGTGTAIGSGYYFDSLVKFTAFEGEQTVDLNGGKLAIWLQENVNETTQEPESTNLVITAGYLDDQGGVVATNYTCTVPNVDLNDGGWHRVTVKAIADITNGDGVPGFVVFVDKKRAASSQAKSSDPNFASSLSVYAYNLNSEGALFPSAVQTLGKDEISSVQFDGQGDVDDLLFTATAPDFAEDDKFFAIYLGEHVTSVQGYDPDGNLFTISGTTNFVVDAETSKTVQILEDYVTCDTGWMFGSVTNEAGQTVSGSYTITADGSITVTARKLGATVTINNVDTPYETLADAIDAINALAADASVKVTLNDAATSDIMLLNTEDANISVVLDLAGNNITGDGPYAEGVVVASGSLLITNSTTEVIGHVIAAQGYSAVAAANADLTIAGGVYDGLVDVGGATTKLITGGSFSVEDNKDPDSETVPPAPNGDLAAAALAAGNELVVGSGSASYYIVQEKAVVTTWTVTFLNDDDSTYDEVEVEDGQVCALPESPTKTGYTFAGWYPDNIGALQPYDFNQPITADVTVKARYTADTYTITLDAGENATVDPATTNYTVESGAITLPTPTTSLIGVTFGGWTNETVTTAITAYTPAAGDGSFTLYAKWDAVAPCTITLVSGDNSTVDPSSINFWAGQSAITLPTPVLNQGVTGVTFGGWTNETITTAITEYTPPAENAESFTLYAKWDAVVPTYPSYIDTSDSTITGQYDTWASTYSVPSGANDYETAFLLNVAPETLGATLAVTEFSISGTTVTIDVNRGNLNGYPYVKKAATVAGLASATAESVTVVPADNIENGGRVTLTGESGTTQFYLIGVQVAPVAVPNQP